MALRYHRQGDGEPAPGWAAIARGALIWAMTLALLAAALAGVADVAGFGR